MQLGNKAGFLRTEITPLAGEITVHAKYDRTLLRKIVQVKSQDILIEHSRILSHLDVTF